MKKRILIITVFLMLFLTNSCKADTFNLYKDVIYENSIDPSTRKMKGGENDVNDLSGCPVLFELGEWESREIKGYKKYHGRHQSWISGTIYHGTGVSMNLPIERGYKDLAMILNDKSFHPVYIGHWHYSPKIQKNIRFFAYQKKEGGPIDYQYESQTPENKNIKEKPFSLSPSGTIAPDKSSLCSVKWIAKFGYNAVAEVKSRNRFSKNYLVPTGKIIEAKE